MKISIFTPVHKVHRFFDMCINSICSQTHTDWEWIILDNSSGYVVGDYVKNQVRKVFPSLQVQLLDKIKVYKQLDDCKNIGHLKNVAANLCTGDIIVEMDYDDYMMKDALYVIAQAAEKTDADFFYTDWFNIEHFSSGGFASRSGRGSIDKATDITYLGRKINASVFGMPNVKLADLRGLVIPIHLRIWRREFLHLINGFDSNLVVADDFDVMYKSFIYGKCCRISYPCVFINYHDTNTTKFYLKECQQLGQSIFKKYEKQLEAMNDGSFTKHRFIPTL